MENENQINQNKEQTLNELSEQVLQPDADENLRSDVTTQEKNFPIKKLLIILGVFFVIILLLLIYSRYQGQLAGPSTGDGVIKWWVVKEDVETLRPLADEFERQNPNISVVLVPQAERDYQERLSNALNSDDPPDLFEIHKSWIPMYRQSLYTLPSSVMSQEEFTNSFYPIISADVVSDQGVMAIPIFYDAITLYINTDIFTRAARIPPTTWIEFEETSQALTQRNGNLIIQAGSALGFTENVDYWPDVFGLLMYQNGASLSNPTGVAALGAINFYKSFAEQELWDTRLPSSTNFFAQGQLAMYFGPVREAQNILNANPSLRFRTIPLPQLPKQRPDEPNVSYTTYYVNGVFAQSGDRDDAWRLLKFITERESLIRLNDLRKERGLFPKPYPKVDMANLQSNDPVLGSVLSLASEARSWYLADDRVQGENSISDQLKTVYAQYLDAETKVTEEELPILAQEIQAILSKFGVGIR